MVPVEPRRRLRLAQQALDDRQLVSLFGIKRPAKGRIPNWRRHGGAIPSWRWTTRRSRFSCIVQKLTLRFGQIQQDGQILLTLIGRRWCHCFGPALCGRLIDRRGGLGCDCGHGPVHERNADNGGKGGC